jgi:2-keto-3-deoxy-L-rhamnonate aldolase RhmA
LSVQRTQRAPRGRRLFREGSATIGVGVSELFSPSLFSVLAAGGADYGLVDMEHTSFSYRDVAALIASAHATELPVIVRPPEVNRSAIGRVLDLGADGVLVPRIGGGEDAATAVRFAKYRPLGDRGDDGRIVAVSNPEDRRALIDAVNRNTTVIAILETKDGVENIDDICTTAGIDGVWIGPADLSLSLDVPGDLGSTPYRAAEERILDSCRAHGMPFAIGAASTPAAALEQIRLGCFTVIADDEVLLLTRAISDYVVAVKKGLA